jgi:putative nucleotidyltransferase with HDIG domain
MINKVTHLPPFPPEVPQLLELLRKEDVEAGDVVTLISYDPGLTANVMRLCNSVFFGSARPAADLEEAVLRLGFDEVYQLVLVLSSASALMPGQKGYGLEPTELWKHSVVSALAAKVMARDRGDEDNIAFTAGLLHDVGKVVLAQALDESYARLMQEVQDSQSPLLETEKKLLGVQHAEVGGRMLARWKFSSQIVAAVWSHHDPAMAGPHKKLASYMYLANMVAYFMGYGYGHVAFAMRGRAEALEITGMQPSDLPRYMLETFDNLEKVKGLLNFSF